MLHAREERSKQSGTTNHVKENLSYKYDGAGFELAQTAAVRAYMTCIILRSMII